MNRKEEFFVEFKSLENNDDWQSVYSFYKKNIDIFEVLIRKISKTYNITLIEARDSILHELFSIHYSRKERKRFHKFNRLKWFLSYILIMFFTLGSGLVDFIFTPFMKKIKYDILYEDMWQEKSWYSRFYKYIDLELKNKKLSKSIFFIHPGMTKDFSNINIEGWRGDILNRRYRSLLFDYKISFNIFYKDLFFLYQLNKMSKKINIVLLYLRIIKKMLTYSSQVKKIKAKVLIGAGDYYWNPIKYIYYKKSIDNIVLLQHNFKNEYLHNRLFQYCDYYYAHSNQAIEKIEGIDFASIYSIGSLQLIPFLKKEELVYDILFINQTVDDDLTNTFPDLNQKLLQDSYYLLIDNFKKYLEKYKKVNTIYVAKAETINNLPSTNVKKIYNDLKNIKFVGAYGAETFNLIQKSKLIINMYSSLGFEAYGLDKKVLWINYNGCCDSFKYDSEKEDLHVMISDTSYEAFEERINLLLSDNKKVDEHYKKLKEKYMNIQGNPAKIVADKINEILEEVN